MRPSTVKQSGGSVRNIRDTREGIKAVQEELDRKELERVNNLPTTKLTKQNIELIRQIANTENQIARQNAYAESDPGLDCKRFDPQADRYITVAEVERAMTAAYYTLTDFLARTKGVQLSPYGQERLGLYSMAQQPPVDLCSGEVFITIFHRMSELSLFDDEDFEN